MRIAETVKLILKKKNELLSSNNNTEAESVVTTKDDVHYVPPGAWPTRGPKPSKIGVLFYYLSLAFCVIGILFMGKAPYALHDDRMKIVMVGSVMIAIGFFFLAISNYIYNREQRRLVEYLQGKVEELMAENRGKGTKPLDS